MIDINSRAVLGSFHIGVGQTQLNNFLATLNVPTMNSQLFKMRKRKIGNSIEKVAKASCEVYLKQEKENAEKSKRIVCRELQYHTTWVGRKEAKGTTHSLVTEHQWV